MQFYDVVAKRRSIRGYLSDPVSKESLERIARAVNLAPTACNRQPVRIQLVVNPAVRAKICGVYSQAWLAEAPAIAVVQVDATSSWTRLEGESIADIDGAILMEHFVLAATEEGLGSCWICAFHRAQMDKALNTPAPWRTFAISPLGYPKADAVRPFERKKMNEVFQVID